MIDEMQPDYNPTTDLEPCAKCFDREVQFRKQFYDDILFRYAGVPKR
ncbi:hypothetical protein G6L11_14080 [Agrobacterium tumefaciens]|nr:hypothetical protein [Agrobacterium tumefaciens]